MPRIVYLLANSGGGIQGGHKMIVRHVEALRELGFDAVCYVAKLAPTWFAHRAPLVHGVHADDVVVLPDDARHQVEICLQRDRPVVIFSQNADYFAASGVFQVLERYPPERRPQFITVAPGLTRTVQRLFPGHAAHTVPCFADERLFHPRGERKHRVVYTPRKRPLECRAIIGFFRQLHPGHADLRWAVLDNADERDVADGFAGSTLFLSLSRMESVGMTPLEAMASGCLCAGFLGRGGREFATPENGFWVEDDDCIGAADAVAQAADLIRTGGAGIEARLEAGFATARQWSYAAFRERLEEVWMTIAPECRVKSGALDDVRS